MIRNSICIYLVTLGTGHQFSCFCTIYGCTLWSPSPAHGLCRQCQWINHVWV